MHLAYEILRCLADGQYHSGTKLAARLKISRASIWKGVTALKKLNLPIQAVSGRGYRWYQPIPLLDKTEIMAAIADDSKAKIPRIDLIPIITSTNDHLLSRIPLGLPAGTVCVAEAQTKGRGRMGKTWVSPLGANIYVSFYWHFAGEFQALSGLSLLVGQVALETLHSFAPLPATLGMKWPNDIWHGQRKMAGILIESLKAKTGGTDVVIGMGVNVNMPEGDENWTDVKHALGMIICRNAFIGRFVDKLLKAIHCFEQQGFAPFQADWQQYDLLKDRAITLTQHTKQETGTAQGINERGELLVRVGETLKAIQYGEVSIRL